MSSTSSSILPQLLLSQSRIKLARETSAGDPRLFKSLLCANMADDIATRLTKENDMRHTAPSRIEQNREIWSNGINLKGNPRRRPSAPPSQPGTGYVIPQLRPHLDSHIVRSKQRATVTTSSRTLARPQASARDRAIFIGYIKSRGKACNESVRLSDGAWFESDAVYSDGGENSDEADDENGSDRSINDATGRYTRVGFSQPGRTMATDAAFS